MDVSDAITQSHAVILPNSALFGENRKLWLAFTIVYEKIFGNISKYSIQLM